ncbi:MAG TPA: Fe-S cluster assembly protein HesB [Thermoanaerobaculia bacterium]
MRTRISLPPNFHFDAVVRSHGWYDLPPFSYDSAAGTLSTSVARGRNAADITFRQVGDRLEISSETLDSKTASRIARRVFSLDSDLEPFASSISREPNFRRALARGGGRMLRSPTAFEDAVKVLFTTNCSWEATRGMVQRLIAIAGPGGRAFPPPDVVARMSAARLKAKVRCGYRAESLVRFARRVSSGKLDLEKWQANQVSSESLREAILEEHGFGPYAAENILRILGRHDFLALDSWVRKKYRQLYPGPVQSTDGSIARRYAKYGNYRGLALWLDMTRDWHEEKEKVWP